VFHFLKHYTEHEPNIVPNGSGRKVWAIQSSCNRIGCDRRSGSIRTPKDIGADDEVATRVECLAISYKRSPPTEKTKIQVPMYG
jgi:hypothetical protein